MWRAFGWLGIATLALCAHWFDSDACRVACAIGPSLGAVRSNVPLKSVRAIALLMNPPEPPEG